MSKIENIDRFLEKHRTSSFIWAVIKKYRRDDASRLGALITYYGFLSLFPLLLAVTSGLQLFLKNNDDLRTRLADGFSHYFPVLSVHLQNNIHSIHKTGLALVVGLLLTIYGAKGGADAIRHAFNIIWKIPKEHQPGFPASIVSSFKLIVWGGGGLVLTAVLSSYAAGLAHSFIFSLILLALSLLFLTGVFYTAFKIVVVKEVQQTEGLLTSAVTAAIGVQVLHTTGGYILTHELKNLTTLYGTFAIVLGLIFWIYFGVQVLLFAAEAGSVHSKKTP